MLISCPNTFLGMERIGDRLYPRPFFGAGYWNQSPPWLGLVPRLQFGMT